MLLAIKGPSEHWARIIQPPQWSAFLSKAPTAWVIGLSNRDCPLLA